MLETQVGIAGLFKIDLLDDKGQLVTEGKWQKNLVTNQGLDLLFNTDTIYIGVGTSDAVPAVTDTTINVGKLYINAGGGTILEQGTYWDKTNNELYSFKITKYRIQNTETSAKECKEVGFFKNSDKAITRALITSPITLPPNWYLDVTYELRYYLPTDVKSTSISADIDGTPKQFTAKTRFMSTELTAGKSTKFMGTFSAAYTKAFGQQNTTNSSIDYVSSVQLFSDYPANDELNTGIASSASSITAGSEERGTYINGTYYIDRTLVIPFNQNLSTPQIKSVVCTCGIGYFVTTFDDGSGNGIEKDNTKELTLTIRTVVGQHQGTIRSRT